MIIRLGYVAIALGLDKVTASSQLTYTRYNKLLNEEKLNKWIRDVQSVAGDDIGNDIKRHIREEYSSFDWIMRGIIEKAGFTIENSTAQNEIISTYVCSKTGRNALLSIRSNCI